MALPLPLPPLPSDEELMSSLGPDQQGTLRHRLFGFSSNPIPIPLPEDNDSDYDYHDGLAAARTLGPFRDSLGRSVVVDVSVQAPVVPIQFAGQSMPCLWVESPRAVIHGPPTTIYMLAPGRVSSVWVAAALFSWTPSATLVATQYVVGFRISRGHLLIAGHAPAPAVGASDPIIIPDATSIRLILTLEAEPLGDGASLPAQEFAVQTPTQVTFTLTSTSIALASMDQATATVLGTSLTFSRLEAPAAPMGATNRVGFPLSANLNTLTSSQSSTHQGFWTGQAQINAAFWTLAVTAAELDSSDLPIVPPASGAGGIILDLQKGLSVTVKGQDRPIDCGPCTALAEGSTLVVTGGNARGGSQQRKIRLPGPNEVVLVLPLAYTFRHTNQHNGHESWAVIDARCSFKLDQPRTANGTPFALTAQGSLVFLMDHDSVACMLKAAAFMDPAHPTNWSFALRNLLVTANFITVTAYGLYDITGAILNDGNLLLDCEIQRQATPMLPDPYTSDIQAPLDYSVSISLAPGATGSLILKDISFTPVREIELLEDFSPNTLLDLSSKVSHFGVTFQAWQGFKMTSFKVQDLYLVGPASTVRVWALPAVQWEPVMTFPNPEGFPSPLVYPDCGANTLIGSPNAVTLIPIVPRQAIDTIVSLYQANPPSDIEAQFTLPFGLLANATLTRSILPLVPSPSLSRVGPSFSAQHLQSVDQLSIRGPGRSLITGIPQPSSPPTTSIPGTVTLLRNALVFGQPSTTTVLDAIQDTFDTTFTQDPRIPVTRIDISGFGESMFSDWRDPSKLPPTISKAAFDVIVGRTAREVVQASSILYPYGVMVVRNITIERQNSGAVVRHDSGWQAVSDGRYQFPVPAGTAGLVTHPGLVKGVTNVRNLRDLGAGQTYILADPAGNIELMPVKFDCTLQIENVVAGGDATGVAAVNQLGYVQITKLPGAGSLSASQYATMLAERGPLGGVVDCVTNIGNSGLLMRILRVQVGASNSPSTTEFAVAVYGSPVLPKGGPGGQWGSVLSKQGAISPQSVDTASGVPLTQQNATGTGTLVAQPYRFADPSDLLVPDAPEVDYGLLFSTPPIRVLFLRPVLKPSAPFQLTSTVTPFLADTLILSTTTGPFPSTLSCIAIRDPNWSLAISPAGQLELQLSAPTFQTSSLRRILHDNPNLRSIAYTSDDQTPPRPSVVTLAINSATSTWACKITNISFAVETNDYGEALRVVGTMDASSSAPPTFSDPRLVFGPKLSAVTKLMNFMEDFSTVPPMGTSFDSTSVTGSVLFNLQKALAAGGSGPFTDFIKNFVIDMDFKISFYVSDDDTNMEMGGDLTFKLPVGAFMIVWLGAVDLTMKSDGNVWAITAGVGYGYNVPLAEPVEMYAYAAVAMHITVGSGVFGFGMSVLIKADIDFVVVEASATAEVRGDMIHVTCGPNPGDKTLWAVGQIRLALEITLFLVADIEFDYAHEWTKNTDNGPCALPDVV